MDQVFESLINDSISSNKSIVLRYASEFACGMSKDRFLDYKKLLERTSIREGARIVELLEYKGVQIHLLDETTLMHTGTMRSLTGCTISARCILNGLTNVVCESGGNSGSAIVEYCTNQGIESFLFLPNENISLIDSKIFKNSLAHLIGVEKPSMVKDSSKNFSSLTGFERIPRLGWRYEASMYRGLFILENMIENGTFDWITQTVSAAFGPIGIYNVLQKYKHRIKKLPKFLGIQQLENAPLYTALKNKDYVAQNILDSTEHLLSKVLYDVAPQTYGTIDAVKSLLNISKGDLTTLSRKQFRDYISKNINGDLIYKYLLAKGIKIPQINNEPVEKIGLISLLGTIKSIDNGTIKPSSKVLCCFTGGTSHADGKAKAEFIIRDEVKSTETCYRNFITSNNEINRI